MLQGNSVLNKWPSLCLSFMLEHIPFLPWTWGWLLKADGSFSKWSRRLVPLICMWPRAGWWSCSSCLDYCRLYLPFQLLSLFLEVIQNTAAKTLPAFPPWLSSDSNSYLNITFQPPGVLFSDLCFSSAQLISSVKCSANVAYRLAYHHHSLIPLIPPPLPNLRLLPQLPPAPVTGRLEWMPLCSTASLSLSPSKYLFSLTLTVSVTRRQKCCIITKIISF